MRTNATAEAAEAILTKLLRETRYPSGSASVSCLTISTPPRAGGGTRTHPTLRPYCTAYLPDAASAAFGTRTIVSLRTVAPLLASPSLRVNRMFSMSQRNKITFVHAGVENLEGRNTI